MDIKGEADSWKMQSDVPCNTNFRFSFSCYEFPNPKVVGLKNICHNEYTNVIYFFNYKIVTFKNVP